MGLCTPWLWLCTLRGLRAPPWLLLCTLHAFRTLPMAFAPHTPWVPHTSHGFGSAHSMGSVTSHGFCSAHSMGPVHFQDGFGLHTPWAPNTPIAFLALFQDATLPISPLHSAIAKFKRPNAMLSRRRATVVVRANWWDGGRLEHLVRPHSTSSFAHPMIILEH